MIVLVKWQDFILLEPFSNKIKRELLARWHYVYVAVKVNPVGWVWLPAILGRYRQGLEHSSQSWHCWHKWHVQCCQCKQLEHYLSYFYNDSELQLSKKQLKCVTQYMIIMSILNVSFLVRTVLSSAVVYDATLSIDRARDAAIFWPISSNSQFLLRISVIKT